MKRYIDIEAWPRKEQYKLFKEMDYPHFNICANVDITILLSFLKEKQIPFFKTMVYLSTVVANSIPEFRYRMQNNEVAEYDAIQPSFTALTKPEVFSFCTVDFMESFSCFINEADKKVQLLMGKVNVEDEPNRDDLIFITSIPWVSFTSVVHPINLSSSDSIPRISWGKYFTENSRVKLPYSIQVNHALMDGYHVGKYIELLQRLLDNPTEGIKL